MVVAKEEVVVAVMVNVLSPQPKESSNSKPILFTSLSIVESMDERGNVIAVDE